MPILAVTTADTARARRAPTGATAGHLGSHPFPGWEPHEVTLRTVGLRVVPIIHPSLGAGSKKLALRAVRCPPRIHIGALVARAAAHGPASPRLDPRDRPPDGVDRDFYVRQLKDWKLSVPIEQMISAKFDHAIAAFAETYADQNERDHATLQAAVKDGRAEATTELLAHFELPRPGDRADLVAQLFVDGDHVLVLSGVPGNDVPNLRRLPGKHVHHLDLHQQPEAVSSVPGQHHGVLLGRPFGHAGREDEPGVGG
jgi:Uncharacterized protein conserved in bacteria (DUF2252)